jgi:basic membrane lipoprotein Med (substrate-binding protein (PBP1-ABC) superfamily)
VAGTVVSAAPAATGAKPVAVKAGEKLKVGFLYVGPKNDYGYNFAADQGRQYVDKALPWVETVFAENVPENAEAERVMEQMIQQGAKIIFPTSYGHLDPATKEAAKHPEVLFLHQGGILDAKTPPNVGSYFGEIWQAEYPAGIAAGKMTKSNKLGFIAAFPIPQTLLNINGITLGAKSVNPKAEMHVVFTADWCNPGKQTEAAQSLLDQGVDVISQHQDCPGAIIQSTERRGAVSIGYHADASPLAPKTWATAPAWNWGPTYTDLILQAVAGTYKPSNFRTGLESGVVVLAPFGASVPADVKTAATSAMTDIAGGKLKPFTGPLKDQSGKTQIEGDQPDVTKLETMDWLLQGVIGTIPK